MNHATTPTFAFFGTPDIAVTALEEMKTFGYLPSLIVCNPDAPVGRKQVITPPPVKVWAEAHGIPVLQPTTLTVREELAPLTDTQFDFFVVLAYGKLIPEWLLTIPTHGTINAHPSLLPKLRGASPIRSTLLQDLSAAGVTIMQMDAKLDHGPILAQQPVELHDVPVPGRQLDTTLARISGDLLVDVMQKIPAGEVTPTPQDHQNATFCTKLTKDMAEVVLDPHQLPIGPAALTLYKKVCAFDGWPGVFFFYQNQRVKITSATYDTTSQTITIQSVIPAGKKETSWAHYLDSIRSNKGLV